MAPQAPHSRNKAPIGSRWVLKTDKTRRVWVVIDRKPGGVVEYQQEGRAVFGRDYLRNWLENSTYIGAEAIPPGDAHAVTPLTTGAITMTTTATKTRTITLTGRAPVKIVEADWPVIAHGNSESFDNQFRFQSNETTDIDIRVRQHADGRALVYGVYDHDTRFPGRQCALWRCGVLLEPGADLAAAVQSVGDELLGLSGDAECTAVTRACIADLPPVTI